MGNKNSIRNTKTPKRGKTFPIGVTLLLILLFSCTTVAACITEGFTIDALITFITEGSGADMLALCFSITAVLITGALVLIFVLIRHRDPEKKNRFTESYTESAFLVLTIIAIGTAVTLFTLGDNNNSINFIVALAIFPTVGIISTPNAVRYALKDLDKWEKIFYGNGNLHRYKDNEDFYIIKTPVSFERKLFWVVFRNQVLDHVVVISIMLLFVIAGITRMIYGEREAAPGLIGAIAHVKAERATGFILFAMIIIAAFGIPILAYYVTNAVSRLSVVKKHKYIAYHAIVKGVRSYKITIYDKPRKYSYNYATCVGIREKNVHDTRAILIFIPDDVLIFPDKET